MILYVHLEERAQIKFKPFIENVVMIFVVFGNNSPLRRDCLKSHLMQELHDQIYSFLVRRVVHRYQLVIVGDVFLEDILAPVIELQKAPPEFAKDGLNMILLSNASNLLFQPQILNWASLNQTNLKLVLTRCSYLASLSTIPTLAHCIMLFLSTWQLYTTK